MIGSHEEAFLAMLDELIPLIERKKHSLKDWERISAINREIAEYSGEPYTPPDRVRPSWRKVMLRSDVLLQWFFVLGVWILAGMNIYAVHVHPHHHGFFIWFKLEMVFLALSLGMCGVVVIRGRRSLARSRQALLESIKPLKLAQEELHRVMRQHAAMTSPSAIGLLERLK